MRKIAIIMTFFFILSCKSDKKKLVLPKNKIEISKINNAIDSSKNLNVTNQKVEDSTEDNDTYLKGGFSIIYTTDDEDQYLIYKKGKRIIDTLNSCSVGLPMKNLGYVISDFDNTFILGQSYGSGNPTVVELYEKETAKKLLKEYSAIIDVDSTNHILLYSENDVPKLTNKMTLFDVKKNIKENYDFPKEVFGEPEILNRIHLINISDKTFTIECEFNDYRNTKRQKYTR